MPDEPEALGLLALMLLQDARREARTSAPGELIVLEEQDRTLWDRNEIAEGSALVERALRMRRAGPYQLQAAIAALHCGATQPEDDRLAADRGALRRTDSPSTDSRCGAQPRGRRRDGDLAGGGPTPAR